MYQLEKQLGMTRHAIDKCNVISISWEKVALIANYFGTSVDYLIGNSSNPYSHKQLMTPGTKMIMEASEESQISVDVAKIITKIIKALAE